MNWKGWLGAEKIPSTFLELVQTGLMDVRHDASLKLSPCTEIWGEFLAMVLVLCGARRERQRSGEHVCIRHSAKATRQHRKRTVDRSASGGGVGTAGVIDLLSCKQLKLLWGERWYQSTVFFSLNYILEWSFICKKYFLSKREKNIICTKQLFLFTSVQTSRIFFLMFHITIATFKYVFVWMWFPNC